jgi:hypothetical protein
MSTSKSEKIVRKLSNEIFILYPYSIETKGRENVYLLVVLFLEFPDIPQPSLELLSHGGLLQ